MDEENAYFKWKTFPTHISSTFKDLASEGHFADVTLVSDDQVQTTAHKLVLSACSPVMKNILLNNPHSKPLIYLKGVKDQELQSILHFMYFGETTIHQDSIADFMDVAHNLEIKELCDRFNIEEKAVNDNQEMDEVDSSILNTVETNHSEIDAIEEEQI